MQATIQTQNLFKDYLMGSQAVHILHDINIAIEKGEFVSIMGPSGSGKSTLLYLLGSLDRPTSGSVWVDGRELSSMNDSQQSAYRRKSLGFVFQFYNLVPNLTVEENILMPVLLDGKRAKDYQEKLDEILETVGLKDRRKHMPGALSGGQQQRTAIARALIHEPEIVLADEPIGNLDSKTGMEIMELFKRINKEKGKTVVQVTHSSESAGFGTRTIYLKDGKVV